MGGAEIFVSGVGLYLAPAMPAEEAVERGLTDLWTVRRTRMRSVCVGEESGPEMAVKAARDALRHAGAAPDDIDLVLHASTYFQGHDLWAPASYVQRESIGDRPRGACPAMDVGQLSNGGLAAMELAAAYLRADPRRHSALITTGDRFCPPGFDRWATDPGTVCGDGGTALVLSRVGGFARLRSLVTVSDPALEKMGRGADPFGAGPLTARVPISLEQHRALLMKELGASELIDRLRAGQRAAYERALAEAGLQAKEIAWFVVPNLGHPKMEFQFFTALDIDPGRTTWPWGSGVGHLGAGDQIAGLAHLVRIGALAPGQSCALIGAGGGFAWTVAVLDVLRIP
ncbi:ketoacyl-ACP synthase III family protein [Thermomonospora sp. CIF 1]|uniref:ketoacyl-ACP synthase III family protein n=1 Tax=Thermomonospora sp. CIF 1 TaxID=1916083 RepID=UPI000AF91AA0|nr:ketoacyl-ACP synthase III family protein [Thermomonospora sp. CIF 1]PKK13494.1 MAG: 3-oxoacyl-ACP synthase [Thermomonospora sp. CIF 1]